MAKNSVLTGSPLSPESTSALRRILVEAAADPAADSMDQTFRSLASDTPTSLDDWWSASRDERDGPIDVIDLFSGCGGMSAGFRAVNGVVPAFRHILAGDIDDVANRTYEMNLGLVPEQLDVEELARKPTMLRRLLANSGRRAANPLILIGCAPCQGFSSYRNAAGATDSRNRLFEDFATVAVRLKPDFVIIENVPELCTDAHWPRVERVRGQLMRSGYRVHLAVHNFAEFGLPQERFRAVMLASRRPFTEPTGFLERGRFRTVRNAIGSLPYIDPGQPHPSDAMHITAGHRQSTIDMIRTVPKNGGRRPLDGGPLSLRELHKRQGKPGYEDVYGRLAWEKPAITITHYSRNPASGRFVHPEQDRGLSVREAALLQGFPREFVFAGTFDDRFRQIGNAVPPVVAAGLALTVLREMIEPSAAGPTPGITAPLARSFSRLIPALKARTKAITDVPAHSGSTCA